MAEPCRTAPEWRPRGCPHGFSADVTEQMERWMGLFGVPAHPDRAYYLDIHEDGSTQLCDVTDGGAGVVFDLLDFPYCPLCGAKYRKEEDHDS